MLQAERSDTYVLATQRTETVRDFVTMAARAAGIELSFEGSGVQEVGIDRASRRTLVRVNPRYFRPAEVDLLIGDASKVKRELGWVPQTTLEQLCQMMVAADLRRVETNLSL